MLAKAHVTIGMAAAFTVAQPQTIPEALPVIVGASLGCLICDIDCDIAAEKTDSSHWRIVMAAIAVAALIEDHLLDAGMWQSLADRGSYLWFAGLVGFVLTCTFAGISSHRGFSHSLLALALETISVWLVFPMAAMPFAIAFASHLILDVMNKRPVRLLYPAKKGVSLKWFYADRLANKFFAVVGSIWLIAVIIVNRLS
jgi:inner membrane protein